MGGAALPISILAACVLIIRTDLFRKMSVAVPGGHIPSTMNIPESSVEMVEAAVELAEAQTGDKFAPYRWAAWQTGDWSPDC